MPSTALAGYGGRAKIGGVTILEVDTWELPISIDSIDTAVMGTSNAKTYIPGMYGSVAKVSFFWDQINDAAQATMQTDFLAGTIFTFVLSPNTGTNNYTNTGAFVKDFAIKADVKGAIKCDCSIQCSGSITYA